MNTHWSLTIKYHREFQGHSKNELKSGSLLVVGSCSDRYTHKKAMGHKMI